MSALRPFPPRYERELRALEPAYLESDDPIEQSGFHGGPGRWRAERGAILDAIESDGSLLDVGCANGYLLECLVHWGAERGIDITPHGLDLGAKLIGLAKDRLPEFSDNFHVGNVWEWRPPIRYDYVYMIWDCLPQSHLADGIRLLLRDFLTPGGRFILGSYGSLSRNERAFDIAEFVRKMGVEPAGEAWGGDPPLTLFVWMDAPR